MAAELREALERRLRDLGIATVTAEHPQVRHNPGSRSKALPCRLSAQVPMRSLWIQPLSPRGLRRSEMLSKLFLAPSYTPRHSKCVELPAPV